MAFNGKWGGAASKWANTKWAPGSAVTPVNVSMWFIGWTGPPPPKKGAAPWMPFQTIAVTTLALAENVTLDKWYEPFQPAPPPREMRRGLYFLEHKHLQETLFPPDPVAFQQLPWQMQMSERLHRVKRACDFPIGELDAISRLTPESTVLGKWYQPFNLPVWIRPAGPARFPVLAIDAFQLTQGEVVRFDGFYRQWEPKPPPRRPLVEAPSWPLTLDTSQRAEAVALAKFHTAFSLPVWRRRDLIRVDWWKVVTPDLFGIPPILLLIYEIEEGDAMYEFAPGTLQPMIDVYLRDAGNGQAKLGINASSPGANVSWVRENGTAVNLPLVDLATPTDPWTPGGIKEISQTFCPGLYRLHLPTSLAAAGAKFANVTLGFGNTLNRDVTILLRNPVNNVGAGGISWVVTVNNTATGLPLQGASVWVSTDLAGANVVAGSLQTNSFGQVTFLLDAGTYYLWVRDAGYTGTNPTAFTVS